MYRYSLTKLSPKSSGAQNRWTESFSSFLEKRKKPLVALNPTTPPLEETKIKPTMARTANTSTPLWPPCRLPYNTNTQHRLTTAAMLYYMLVPQVFPGPGRAVDDESCVARSFSCVFPSRFAADHAIFPPPSRCRAVSDSWCVACVCARKRSRRW